MMYKTKIVNNQYRRFLKALKFNGGEVGSEPTNELRLAGFQDLLSTAQPPLR